MSYPARAEGLVNMDDEATVIEIWRFGNTPSWSLLPGPLLPEVIVSVSLSSFAQLDLF